jgi:hypothetical protein
MQGDHEAENNPATIERYMTTAQIAEARKVACEWKSKR